MTGDDFQPFLPFGECRAELHGLEIPLRASSEDAAPALRHRAPEQRLPASLAAFAAAWECADAETAMRRACTDLRQRTEQQVAPFALTPMLEILSATRADAPAARGAHGRLSAARTGWTIYRRTDLPWRRVRFTEAHEVGHILLYEKLASNRSWLDDLHSAANHQRVERLCDLAASELLMPAEELTRHLTIYPLASLRDYLRLYDLYLTSHRALLRRIAEITPDTALTVWAWQGHRNGANWRIQESYCRNTRDAYIPRGISRRRLDPDVVGMALDAGLATAGGSVDVRPRRLTNVMTALYPDRRDQTELPVYHGRPVRDEHGANVFVLHRKLTSTAHRAPRMLSRRSRAS